jgi:hypothetical protein
MHPDDIFILEITFLDLKPKEKNRVLKNSSAGFSKAALYLSRIKTEGGYARDN